MSEQEACEAISEQQVWIKSELFTEPLWTHLFGSCKLRPKRRLPGELPPNKVPILRAKAEKRATSVYPHAALKHASALQESKQPQKIQYLVDSPWTIAEVPTFAQGAEAISLLLRMQQTETHQKISFFLLATVRRQISCAGKDSKEKPGWHKCICPCPSSLILKLRNLHCINPWDWVSEAVFLGLYLSQLSFVFPLGCSNKVLWRHMEAVVFLSFQFVNSSDAEPALSLSLDIQSSRICKLATSPSQ